MRKLCHLQDIIVDSSLTVEQGRQVASEAKK